MDRAGRQGVAHAPGAERHIKDSCILDKHRDDNITFFADLGNRRCHARARSREFGRRLSHDIVDSQIMFAFQDASRHPFTHTA